MIAWVLEFLLDLKCKLFGHSAPKWTRGGSLVCSNCIRPVMSK